jgi:hypothetical protein
MDAPGVQPLHLPDFLACSKHKLAFLLVTASTLSAEAVFRFRKLSNVSGSSSIGSANRKSFLVKVQSCAAPPSREPPPESTEGGAPLEDDAVLGGGPLEDDAVLGGGPLEDDDSVLGGGPLEAVGASVVAGGPSEEGGGPLEAVGGGVGGGVGEAATSGTARAVSASVSMAET